MNMDKQTRILWKVVIADEEYITKAYTKSEAVNNAALRHADYIGKPVALTRWLMNEGKIDYYTERV